MHIAMLAVYGEWHDTHTHTHTHTQHTHTHTQAEVAPTGVMLLDLYGRALYPLGF